MKITLLNMIILFVRFVVPHKIIKKGTITKNKQDINGKCTEFKEQQYKCKKCNKKFGINNNPLIKKTMSTIYKK